MVELAKVTVTYCQNDVPFVHNLHMYRDFFGLQSSMDGYRFIRQHSTGYICMTVDHGVTSHRNVSAKLSKIICHRWREHSFFSRLLSDRFAAAPLSLPVNAVTLFRVNADTEMEHDVNFRHVPALEAISKQDQNKDGPVFM